MLIHDGRYTWPPPHDIRTRPVSWWTSSYRVQIFDLQRQDPAVRVLQPYVVILTDTGEGASAENCLPELAKHICRDFRLPLDQVRWIEQRAGSAPQFDVITFAPLTSVGGEPFFRVTRRPAGSREAQLVHACLDAVRIEDR
jgi:hypothetical protein